MRKWALITALAAYAEANGRHDANGNVIEGLAAEELAVTDSGHLGDRAASIGFWSDLSDAERVAQQPPYPLPANREYNTAAGPKPGMVNVHLVPHTHDDTGWQVTVDQYYEKQVFFIIDTVVQNLADNPDRKFIYVETAFFARWWEEVNDAKRDKVRGLVQTGQLEFINGGWCMHDEASPLWTAMVDQTTRGHQFLLKNFGKKANPRGTWQIDPFGHSNTQAWLLSAEAGMESLFWGRMDWQDRSMRFDATDGSHTEGFEWIWEGSKSLGASAQVFAGNLYGTGSGGYSTWLNFDKDSADQVNDDPRRHDYNADMWVDKFVQDALEQSRHTLTEHQMWACGTDFQYQDADRWYRNLDKLIHYVNLNGTVNAFYSTPSIYTDWKRRASDKVVYEVRTDDIMPLADNAHNYWSGYFTSRPALKRQVRFATNLLHAARLLELATNTSAAEIDQPSSEKRSPPVGDSWTDSLEGTVGVATHHDGMSGTERQDVTGDYEQRISESAVEVEAGLAVAFAKLLKVTPQQLAHCNCNAAADCLNMTVCAATTNAASFTVAAFNPLAQNLTQILRLPVVGADWACEDSAGATVATGVTPLDERTKSLPLLYLNSFNMSLDEIAESRSELANKATHALSLAAPLPAVGLATFRCARVATASFATLTQPDLGHAPPIVSNEDVVVSNEHYEIAFDGTTHLLKSITNKRSKVSTQLSATWGWYNSSVGGCTEYPASQDPAISSPACSDQASGAYMFRPNTSELFYPGPVAMPTLEVVEDGMVTEVRQVFSQWASHVVRLYKGAPYVELEWTAGPIPVDTPWFEPVALSDPTNASSPPLPNNWGKELILKYATGLATNATWHTDSNGKEMVRRVRDERGPSYPHPYNISEPVAGNYYPVNALMALDDGEVEFCVVVDASLGGASLQDGALEFMVHRRLQADDNRGVQEPLNETMCGCNDINAAPGEMGAHGREGDGGCECAGLTVRGRHWLVFDTVDRAHETRRELSEKINFPPTIAFALLGAAPAVFSMVSRQLPPNVKLVTLTSNYASFHDGQWLLRLSHLYEAGEHPTLAQPVTVDLSEIFSQAGLTIASAHETTLTANAPLSEGQQKRNWNSKPRTPQQLTELEKRAELSFEDKVPFDYPILTLRPMEVRTFLATFV